MDNIMMIIFLLLFATCVLFRIKLCKEKEYFFSPEYTKCLKGIMCIVVVLVHIPQEYSNTIQDAIGSFGYICVTLFFLFSAYGLMYSVENKKDYIKKFPRNRLLVLLIPFFISNILSILTKIGEISVEDAILGAIGLNSVSFVMVLIVYYILFYLINRFIKNKTIKYIVLIFLPIIYSALNYKFGWDRWCVEELGLSYGIILYLVFNKYIKRLSINTIIKTVLLGIISAILGILYLKFKNVNICGDYLLKIVLGIAIILFVFAFTYIFRIKNKLLLKLGSISYEVYLLHGIAMYLIQKTTTTQSWIYIYLTIFLTVVFAYILNKFCSILIKRVKV